MSQKQLPGKRTRSQIKLSDDILRVPEQSPMKAARNATRKSSEPPSDMNFVAESEDELLLSPNKETNLQRSKRSVSPAREDEYNSRIPEEENGREFKRMKWDLDENGVKDPTRVRLTSAGHARTNSEPNAGPSREAPRKRAGTASSNNKPHSMSHVQASPTAQSPTGVSGKTRAQSVPLFPSLSSLPHLDLRNPPLSPTRARSPCSSDKYHGLRVYPSPAKASTSEQQPLKMEAFSDDPKVRMEVDEECSVLPVLDTNTSIDGPGNGMVPPPEVSIQCAESLSLPPTTTTSAGHLIVPATPMPSEPTLVISMSPLTPLPSTPLPTKPAVGESGYRYSTGDGWGYDLGKGPVDESPLRPIAQPDFGNPKDAISTPNSIDATTGGQIPRPPLPSPPLSIPAAPAPVNTEKAKPISLRVASHKSLSTSSSGLDAFAFLMKNAAKQHIGKSQDKGKGKAVSLIPKTSTTGAINTKGKGKLESGVRKPSLKDRMRRKEKQEPTAPAKFVPVVFDEDEEEQMEPEKQELRAKTPPVPELVIPELEERPPLLEDVIQERPQEPLPVVPGEPPAVEPSTAQELEAESLPESIVSTEGNLPPQPPSPAASLPETEPDLAGHPTSLKEFIPFPPAISQVHVVQDQHSRAASPLPPVKPIARDDAIEVEVNIPTAVDVPTELQATEEPPSMPQATDIPVEQPIQPPKPKPAPRKRGQSNLSTSTRITRSTLRPPVPPAVKPTVARRAARVTAPTRRNSISAPAPSGSKSRASLETEVPQLPLGSPMQTSSPLQTPSRKFRTPSSSPAKISLLKTPSKPAFTEGSPSPTKIARAVSMFSRPSDVFSADDIQVNQGGSSLSTLSNALEKLKMPAPSRPNTSLGFNHTTGEDDDNEGPPVLVHSTGLEQGGSSSQRNTSRRRSLSIGHGVPAESSKTPVVFRPSSTSKAGLSTNKPQFSQKSMTSFFSKQSSSSTSNPRSVKSQLLGTGKFTLNSLGAKGSNKVPFGTAGLSGGGGKLYPMAKRLAQKVSKKTTLPMVEASPVKGSSGVGEPADDNIIVDGFMTTDVTGSSQKGATSDLGDVFMVPFAKGADDEMQVMESSGSGEKRKDKGKEREKDEDKSGKMDSSRRASLALSQLSQSLSAAPAFGIDDKARMGPPATPCKIARSVSSNYPAPSSVTASSSAATVVTATATASTAASSRSSKSPDKIPTPTGTRSSARQAAKAAANIDSSSPVPNTDPGGSGKKIKGAAATTSKTESLKILDNCVIFVDVRTDDGEEAGSLFIEMLEGLGAKILARVGQTCTHVIFKNGLMSTISRWRLLRDPKPSVVGIAWVVDCVEQRRHVEETPYLIDLKEINVAGTNKRRRSMLPKLISGGMTESTATDVEGDEGEADVSMESTSSVTLDDDLTPLERARRRRSMIFGPPA